MESISSFGNWIRRQRRALDLTQQALAEHVGCSLDAIKKIEHDERHPSRQIAERLADVLDVPEDQREMFLEIALGTQSVDQLSILYEPKVPSKRSALPTGTVTFLYTDIEGSTKLWEQHPHVMASAHARHDQILREAIESNKGYVFNVVGDAFCAAFPTVVDALRAAVNSQKDLHVENWRETPIRVRMGIHTGEAELQPDGQYMGYITLSHVQRIMSIASGGQVLLSFTAHELLEDVLPEGMELRDEGQIRLKDWDRTQHIYQLVIQGLPADFPPLKTFESIPNNLPVQLTSFIGREREIAEAKEYLSQARLLTLVGPGGTGKTRLSLQVAEEVLPSFADGVWFVELAPLVDASSLPQTIATSFRLRELPNMPAINIITDFLRAKQLLLILDNCEHLIDACAKLSDHLLHSCPQLKIIASSREALGIRGEIAYRVPSLSLPDQAQVTREALLDLESAQLFTDRASAANPKFHLTDENASDVAQICLRLDGIPLALELAAVRTTVFSVQEIAAHLDDRFRLLTGGSRTALERHQTLQALIDWSYDLLSDGERKLFESLSVFADGWTFDTAEVVCSDLDVLTLLPQLINKSLVVAEEQENGMRYHLLETIRQYARKKLLEAGESEQLRNRHMEFFLKFAEEATLHFNSVEESEWMSRLEADNDNLRATMDWAMEQDILSALRLGAALYPYWNRYGQEAEGLRLLRETMARFRMLSPIEGEVAHQRIAVQIKALGALQVLSFAQGDFLGSVKVAEEVITLSRQVDDKFVLMAALSYLGLVKAYLGDTETSFSFSEEALGLARELGDKSLLGLALINKAGVSAMSEGDPQKVHAYSEEGIRLLKEIGAQWGLAMASFGTGLFAARLGHDAEARSQFEACLPLFEELKDRHRVNMAYSEIAHIERRQGHFEQAKSYYHKTLLEWQSLGHRAAIAHQLECLAMIAKAEEEDQRAAQLFGAAEILRENTTLPMTPVEQVEYEREVNDLRLNMDEVAFAKAWSEGRALTMVQAIDSALENEGEN